MINSLGCSLRSLRAKLSARRISLPALSLYSKDTSSASSEHLLGAGSDSPLEGDHSDAASYGLRPPSMPVSPGRAFRLPSDETNVEDDQGQIFEGDGIPLIDLCPNGARAHVESSVNEAGQNVTLHLGIDLVKTLQDVLKGRREVAPLQQRLRGAESRIDTSENILEMKRQGLLALSEMLKNPKVDVETLIKVQQDVKVLDREILEMTEYQKNVAERENLTQTLSNNAVYQDFLEERLFGVLDDAMVACNLFEPADEITEVFDKTSTQALSPPESRSSFVSLEELSHRTEFQEQQIVRKNVLDTYRAAEDRFLILQQVFDHRDDQEREQKQAFRNAQADGKVGSMTTEDFDVRFLMGSMQLTTDLKIAQQACFEARGEAMAHGCLQNEPDQESDFVNCSSDCYAASIMNELIAEAPRDRIQCWTNGCEQRGMIQGESRPIDDVYNTDEDDGFVRTEDSASQVARGKRREMIDLYNEYRATQWSPIN
ncbi:MAG: hypothetical protein M1835_005974 [Candelina submexicana]|nr:MAG: hypothetical protein M1835_005974 [Candelina submexicana]